MLVSLVIAIFTVFLLEDDVDVDVDDDEVVVGVFREVLLVLLPELDGELLSSLSLWLRKQELPHSCILRTMLDLELELKKVAAWLSVSGAGVGEEGLCGLITREESVSPL